MKTWASAQLAAALAASLAAAATGTPDGRVRLDYWDDRPEPVDVLLKARRRIGTHP